MSSTTSKTTPKTSKKGHQPSPTNPKKPEKTVPKWLFYSLLAIILLLVGTTSYYLTINQSRTSTILPWQKSSSSIQDQAGSSSSPATNTSDLVSGEYAPIVPTTAVSPTRNLEKIALADESRDFTLGDPKTANITVIEYMDLNCSHCKDFYQTIKTVSQEFGDQIVWVTRHYPVLNSAKRATILECVGEKGGKTAYWQFIEKYFAEVTSTPTAGDDEQFSAWLNANGYTDLDCDQGAMAGKVVSQWDEGNAAGVSVTPSLVFITKSGERSMSIGAMSAEDLRQVIKSYL